MNKQNYTNLFVILITIVAHYLFAGYGQEPLPKVFCYNAESLAIAKNNLVLKKPLTLKSLELLRQQAEQALQEGSWSVMDKEGVAPSGDKHDYYSTAAYWWPDPNSPDGLPYIWHDGKVNPEFWRVSDRQPLERMADSAETLSLYYYFSGEEKYAKKAAELLKVWFMNSETKMNPHLKYTASIPGRTDGRLLGVIQTYKLPKVVDAIGLIENSKHWAKEDTEVMRDWFSEFLDWLIKSEIVETMTEQQRNNISTHYDVQVVSYALFTERENIARKVAERAKSVRIDWQINPDGKQPEEMSRTRTLNYSIMNLEALLKLAHMGKLVEVDLYNYEAEDGSSIRAALDFLAPYVNPDEKWNYKDIKHTNRSRLLPLLRNAANAYGEEKYEILLQKNSSNEQICGLRIELTEPSNLPCVEKVSKSQSYPKVLCIPSKGLLKAKDNISEHKPLTLKSLELLREQAEQALQEGPWSVIDKEGVAPSGDKHDYYSIGAYWWPNPDSRNGLPYIHKDGQVNPDFWKVSDRQPLEKMADSAETLGLYYYFSEDEKYARKAAELIRVWFIDPETKMNPHLKYAQGIKGLSEGRNIGIIDVYKLPKVIDAAGLIENSESWSSKDTELLRDWFDEFLNWMLEPDMQKTMIENQSNNIASSYDIQVVCYALFTGRNDIAMDFIRRAKTLRIDKQIAPDGSQPEELKRTRALNYSIGNLSSLFTLAQISAEAGENLYHYVGENGASLHAALDFLAPYIDPELDWEYQDIKYTPRHKLLPLLRRGANVYHNEKYEHLINKFSTPEQICIRRIELLDPYRE